MSEFKKTVIPEEFIQEMRYTDKRTGKVKITKFIKHEGLLLLFHENGGKSIKTAMTSELGENLVQFKAEVDGEMGKYRAHGDATDENVNPKIKPHKIRMAETRAINRALRLYNNIGMCSIDELGGDE